MSGADDDWKGEDIIRSVKRDDHRTHSSQHRGKAASYTRLCAMSGCHVLIPLAQKEKYCPSCKRKLGRGKGKDRHAYVPFFERYIR